MKLLTAALVIAGIGLFASGSQTADNKPATAKVTVSHGLTLLGELKYPAGFKHLDYVNPNAPKGGTLHRSSTARTVPTGATACKDREARCV